MLKVTDAHEMISNFWKHTFSPIGRRKYVFVDVQIYCNSACSQMIKHRLSLVHRLHSGPARAILAQGHPHINGRL